MKPAQFYLIRGLTRETGHWDSFIDQLKAMDFVRGVTTLEFPGVGRFYHLKSPLNISEYADFLFSQIEQKDSVLIQKNPIRKNLSQNHDDRKDLPGNEVRNATDKKHKKQQCQYRDLLEEKVSDSDNRKTDFGKGLERGPQDPKVIVSTSMGSLMAVEMAKKRKNFFQQIYLMNASFSGISPFYHRLKWKSWGSLISIALTREPRTRESKVLKMVSNNASLWPSLVDSFAEIARKRPCKKINALRQIYSAARYSSGSKAPEGASFVILVSRKDQMVDYRCSVDLSRHWKIPLHIHPWAGHDLSIDDPQWIIKKIREERRACSGLSVG